MGSKISIQDIDQKASDFAKANFMKQLKEHHQNLEKENKELKEFEKDAIKENKDLRRKFLNFKEENRILKAEIEEWEKERDEVLRECVKLAKLVEELREAIEEPKELDDK